MKSIPSVDDSEENKESKEGKEKKSGDDEVVTFENFDSYVSETRAKNRKK